MKGLFGKKLFMGQLFQTDGSLIPVTYIAIGPNLVSQVKTPAKDGYAAFQVVAATKTQKLTKKSQLKHLKTLKLKHAVVLRELPSTSNYQVGDALKADLFQPNELVDVIAVSKGKGTAGVIKRHNFGRGPMSHGSKHHRAPGSVGLSRPDKIWKGQPLPGRKGNQQVTVRNLQIVAVDQTHNLLVLKGSVPGSSQALVQIRSAKQVTQTIPNPIRLFTRQTETVQIKGESNE